MKITKAERQLIALEKGLRNCRKLLSTMIREISPKCRHAVRHIKLTNTERRGLGSPVIPEDTSEDVVAALGEFRIKQGDSGWYAYPPTDIRLSKNAWARIRKIMGGNGGSWNTQRQAFVFEEDPFPIFKALGEGKFVNQKKDRQAFYTPADLAHVMADLAGCKGKTVLEPSAGHGALADACRDAGAHSVICYEIDRTACATLRAKGYSTAHADFLNITYRLNFDRVVMNPPFTKGAFRKHIEHALKCLAPGGLLVSVIPGDEVDSVLKKIIGKRRFICKPNLAGVFKESGTNIQTSVLVVENK